MDRRPFALAFALAFLAAGPAVGGKVTLKNGTELEGDLVEIEGLTDRLARQQAGEIRTTPFLAIDAGYKWYFVADRLIANIDKGEKLIPYDFFDLPQRVSNSSLSLASIGLPAHVEPFDGHGRRTVVLNTPRGKLEIVQGITRIGPQFTSVAGRTHAWTFGIATASIPPEQLSAMIRSAIDPADPDERMSVARFYIEAGLYELAAAELELIAKDFSFLTAKAEELNGQLRQLRAKSLLAEVRRRKAAGQNRLALMAAESFPTDLGFDADVLRQVEELRDGFAADREKGDRALLILGDLEAELEDPARRSSVASLRRTIREHLDADWDALHRLDAFLTLAGDETLPPADRLALAYSGWVVGSAKATTDLPKALALWQARSLVGSYLRESDPIRQKEIVAELSSIESVGPASVEDLIPLLPPWIDGADVTPGKVVTLQTEESVPGWGADAAANNRNAVAVRIAGPVRYTVVLPPEYVPTRSYPMLVALRPAEWSAEQAAEFWGLGLDGAGRPAPGPATRAGYVVIAPEYAAPKQPDYEYSVREHEAILAAIRDAKKRFTIDGDRVFLTGHGMGGAATFDVAMSHPDLFAGAVPISGLCRYFTKWYRRNAEHVPFYVINGERDRDARPTNGPDLSDMMLKGFDVLYCEFAGRGYEYYQEELPNVFAWMARLRRAPDPKKFEVQVLRASDDRFYWVKAQGIPRTALVADLANPQGGAAPRPMQLQARINEGNTITVDSAASGYVLRLNTNLIDVDRRVQVKRGSRKVFNEFVAPDLAALLDDLRENGDRQRLYPIRIVVK